MLRPIPILVVCVSATIFIESALAQSTVPAAIAATQQTSLHDGSVRGTVKDDLGRAIGGASIVALGRTTGLAKTDAAGKFSLALPPGDYVLRATREGYMSTYREPIRVQTSALIERQITLIRLDADQHSSPLLLAGAAAASTARSPKVLPTGDDDASHTEEAWRLRHLTRSILRDVTPVRDVSQFRQNASNFTPRRSFVDSMASNLSGQFNFLTTSLMAASAGWLPTQIPRGIAYLAVRAPIGSQGDWSVRGATTATDLSSWVAVGEYQARPNREHAFGLSYSAQLQPNNAASSLSAIADGTRNVGGLYAFDRWHARPDVELDYGMRFDRYDYLTDTGLLSGRFGGRVQLVPQLFLSGAASQRMIAPGADEFLPPPSEGPWIPPERTFSPLVSGSQLRSETVRRYEVGFERALGTDRDGIMLGVTRFREETSSQIANLFGMDDSTDAGHYYVASPGDIDLDGWTLGVSGRVTPRLSGGIRYSLTDAHRRLGSEAFVLARVAPSIVRDNHERLHDLTTSIDATLPETSTRISVVMRVNSGFSRVPKSSRAPIGDGRFDIEVHQALPFEPVPGGRVEFMLAIRNLFRDLRESASVYDELLTVAPPIRIMGGVQLKF